MADQEETIEIVEPSRGIVIYCDGSSRPNPGNIGWGAHGYLYEIKDLKKPFTIDNHLITNKGYRRITMAADKSGAIPVEPIDYFDFFGSSLDEGTNNKAEILALYHSLLKIADYENIGFINIYTDSEYLMNGVNDWCAKWAKLNWVKQDGHPIANSENWRRIHDTVTELKVAGIQFSIEWVKAHNGVFGNIQADILAVIGMNYSAAKLTRTEFTISTARGYWKNDADKHPFINFRRIYFNSVQKFNIPGKYFQADPGGGDFIIGKRIPEAGFSVIKLNEPDRVIEAIKNKQCDIANDLNAIIMIKLDRAYHKEIYPYLRDHGGFCLLKNRSNLNLNFIDNNPVTLEINPSGLSLRAIESLNFLEELLNSFVKYREIGTDQHDNTFKVNFHDITSTFYDKSEKIVKKEVKEIYTLRADITSAVKEMSLPIVESYHGTDVTLNVPINLGTDILPRNNLKKLETDNPTVFIVTWRESPKSIRYATVIECNSGIGIWSNFYADKLFF